MNEILRTVDLSMKFRTTMVLDHLNMAVPEHSVYAIVGPNGAGKTTTIKILMNARRATGGIAEVFGHDSRKLSPADFAEIGYVSENQQIPDWQFELPPDRKIKNLSHGMRMKVALASSLTYRPKLIVLDEPFTGLDALVRDELIEGVLVCAEGSTILISSHDLSDVESFASHVGYLDGGRLQFSEEMTSLADRFREIEITPAISSQPRASWPGTWLNAEQSATVVRFVDSQFDQERTIAEVHRLFGNTERISVSPMPLRSIFVTLAKAGRKAK
jgi:ABC-2 type transport system ATP-binding protein